MVRCVQCSLVLVALIAFAWRTAAAAGSPGPWSCVGLPAPFGNIVVRLAADGNPECASLDGKKCLRNQDGDTVEMDSCLPWYGDKVDQMKDLKPLRCGEQHKKAWGFTGYDQKGHWCTPAKQALQEAAACKPGASAAGSPCSSGACCTSGLCVPNPNKATVKVAPQLCGCRSKSDCSSRSVCLGGICTLKAEAGKSPLAARGDRADRASSPSPPPALAPGATCLSGGVGKDGKCTCDVDDDCPSDGYCLKAGGTACAPLRVFGEACSEGRQCYTQKCVDGECRDCSSDQDCPDEAKCNLKAKACTHGDFTKPEPCRNGTACYRSGQCLRGRCVTYAGDGDCSSSPVYRERWQCRRALDPLENTCLPVGDRCFSNASCGIAASEDDGSEEGICHGKTCLVCGAAGTFHQRVAAPFDIESEGPLLWCNLLSNWYFCPRC